MSSDRIGFDQVLVVQEVDEAELAAVAFLARYSGRTLEAYRHDLRCFFAWAQSVGLDVLAATRPHIELFRHHIWRCTMAVISTPMVTPSSTLDLTHDDQRRALFAGLAYLGLLITGALGYMFVRGKLFVDHDAARTAANLVGAALTQALVAVTFFALFRRMHRWAAASITAFGLLSAAALMTAAVFSWSALDAALGGSAHDAQLLYRLQGTSWDVGGIFFGLWLLPLGWLVLRTSPMPRLLGWMLLVGGLGYVANTFVHALLPDATGLADTLLIPSTIGELWMIGYLLWRGIAGHLLLVPRSPALSVPTAS